MIIDTHAHVNFNAFRKDGGEAVKRALDNETWMVLVGSQWSTSKRAIEYANKYEKGVYAAVGLHPLHLEKQQVSYDDQEIEFETQQEKFDFDKYRELAQNKKVVAIGEVGLDYYRMDKNDEDKKYLQHQTFLEQMDLAQQLGKPIIVHCREAYDDLFDLLSVFSAGCSSCPHACPGAGGHNQLRGVIHCFTGNMETAKKFVDMGFYLGFTGIITFSDQYDEILKNIPFDKILAETDCPYLSPVPHRGKRNEPLYVKYVVGKIAKARGISFEEAAAQTTKNAKELFNI